MDHGSSIWWTFKDTSDDSLKQIIWIFIQCSSNVHQKKFNGSSEDFWRSLFWKYELWHNPKKWVVRFSLGSHLTTKHAYLVVSSRKHNKPCVYRNEYEVFRKDIHRTRPSFHSSERIAGADVSFVKKCTESVYTIFDFRGFRYCIPKSKCERWQICAVRKRTTNMA
jgi:hypothetical protein